MEHPCGQRKMFSDSSHRTTLQAKNMRGRIIYIMGASGSGKDSLIREMLRRFRGYPLTCAVRRVTRPAAPGEKRHRFISRERFEEMLAAGHFSLHWTRRGLRYGISARSELALAHGISLLVNGSRAAFPQALARYPDLIPVLVTARPHLLRERLLQRGRESGSELKERMADAGRPVHAHGTDWIRIDNSGPLEESAAVLEQELRRALNLPFRSNESHE